MGVAVPNALFQASKCSEVEQRAAPRFTTLIRAAKLVCGKGEFVCVIRDVSATGVGLRCFHAVPNDEAMALEMHNGRLFEIVPVRTGDCEASFKFGEPVPVDQLLQEAVVYPRRQLRLNLVIPITLRTLSGPVAAVTRNISQQGCRIEAAVPLALAQPVIVEGQHIPGIRAKVRWRRDGECGLVFDDTFSLRDFAVYAARLQCPTLVSA
jgi:hypothetical protein